MVAGWERVLVEAMGATAMFGVGGLAGWMLAGRLVRPRWVDVPRAVEIPTPLGICTVCSELLRPGSPTQLYLELNDCHGRQRAKWPVGRGEREVQAIQADDGVGVARVNKEVWAAVVRCNTIDQGAR